MTKAEFYQRYGRDLLIAWLGTTENLRHEEYVAVDRIVDKPNGVREHVLVNTAETEIIAASPKERLGRYCEWHGIVGYAARLYEIATS